MVSGADALDELLDHVPERRRLAELGRGRSKQFNIEDMAAATRAVYREVTR